MINHTYLRNKIADLQEQINRQRIINHRLMSLMEEEMVIIEMPGGTQKRVPKNSVEQSAFGGLIVDGKQIPGAKIVQTPPENTGEVNPDGTPATKSPVPSTPAPSTPKSPDTKEPEKPSIPEVPQPNVDPSGLANQAGPGAAAMANQLAQAGVGAAGQPNQSGGVNLNFANMFAGQFAKGPVNVGGNQQVSSGSGAQTMNFGTMASGNAVVAGGGISGKVATGRGSIDSGNTSTTTNTNSGNTTTTNNTNSGNTTTSTSTSNTNSGNTTTKTNTNSGNRTTNTNSGNSTTNTNTNTNTNSGNRTTNANKNKNVNVSGKGNKVTANENFQLKVNQTLNEMNRLFGRKDGGLRKS
jgi:hypothetical protein